MKRTLFFSLILIILLTALCGCSAKAELPSSEEVREIIPESISIDISKHLPVIETPRTLADLLGGIPRTFTLDESTWEKDFGDHDMQFYHRIGGSDTDNDYICRYEDGDTSVSIAEYDAYYEEDKLSSVFFKETEENLYLDTETWTYSFDRGGIHYLFDYTYDDILLQTYVSHKDNGPSFCCKDGKVIDISYSYRRKSDTITENFDAYYDDNGKLQNIYYYAYSNEDSLVIRDTETTYDSNYISEDAPEEKSAPEETQTPEAAENPQPAEKPAATESPEATPKPARTGFFGKVLDEIEKDFNNIKEDITEDFE